MRAFAAPSCSSRIAGELWLETRDQLVERCVHASATDLHHPEDGFGRSPGSRCHNRPHGVGRDRSERQHCLRGRSVREARGSGEARGRGGDGEVSRDHNRCALDHGQAIIGIQV